MWNAEGSKNKHDGLFHWPQQVSNSLANHSITTSIQEITMAVDARMWESKMFSEDQMVAWENKAAAKQTWQNLQDYFMEKWLEQRQYLHATAKHSHFKDAALTAQELAAAEEEGRPP